jgi:hypothetical protein
MQSRRDPRSPRSESPPHLEQAGVHQCVLPSGCSHQAAECRPAFLRNSDSGRPDDRPPVPPPQVERTQDLDKACAHR